MPLTRKDGRERVDVGYEGREGEEETVRRDALSERVVVPFAEQHEREQPFRAR